MRMGSKQAAPFKTQVACEAAPSTQLIEHKFT